MPRRRPLNNVWIFFSVAVVMGTTPAFRCFKENIWNNLTGEGVAAVGAGGPAGDGVAAAAVAAVPPKRSTVAKDSPMAVRICRWPSLVSSSRSTSINEVTACVAAVAGAVGAGGPAGDGVAAVAAVAAATRAAAAIPNRPCFAVFTQHTASYSALSQ